MENQPKPEADSDRQAAEEQTIIKQALMPRRPSREHLVWAIRIFVALVVVVSVLILLVRFGVVTSENATLIGALIALIGVIITQVVNTRIAQSNQLKQQDLETARAQAQQELETSRAQASSLQSYLEQMGELLIDHQLRHSNKTDDLPRVAGLNDDSDSGDARVVAQAQTLAVLAGESDPTRKRILLLFLYDSALINKENPIIGLANGNLSGANLEGVNLRVANLSEPNLIKANLIKADLRNADLSVADLFGTDLRGADLSVAHLFGADLSGADLFEANLFEADLDRADLTRADLNRANLQGAESLTQEQIYEAFGDDDTKIPDHLQRPAHWSKGDEEKSEER